MRGRDVFGRIAPLFAVLTGLLKDAARAPSGASCSSPRAVSPASSA